MHKNIICLFFLFLLLPKMYKMGGRESKTAEMYTQGERQIFSEPLLLCSAFWRLVQGHLRALNHLSFSSLLYFCESGVGQSQGTKSFSFLLTSQLSQVLSGQSQGTKSFSFLLTSQLSQVLSGQSQRTNSSSFLLTSLLSRVLSTTFFF